MNDFDYLLKQLDLLIGFIDVSEENIYNQIKNHDPYSTGFTIEDLYENNYQNYSNHIITAAFILGFTHFEDFITKCIAKYLITNPEKNDFKVSYKTINEKGDDLISSLASQQSKSLTFSQKIKFIEKNIQRLNTELLQEIRAVNDIRNCLMHNNGLSDDRLLPSYKNGEKIILTASQVHGFGINARKLAEEIWNRI